MARGSGSDQFMEKINASMNVFEKNTSRKSIVICSTEHASFISEDVKLLRLINIKTSLIIARGLRGVIRYFFAPFQAEATISWFLSVYTFFTSVSSLLLRKKYYIILGGVDCANIQSIDYGIWRKSWKKPFLKFALQFAEEIWAVDNSLLEHIRQQSGLELKNTRVVPTGYNPYEWNITESHERISNSVLCVAATSGRTQFLRKGLDTLVKVAQRLPSHRFTVIGTSPKIASEILENLGIVISPNINFIQKIPRETLHNQYNSHEIYVQPSRFEGLPNALCEAILCGCFPIGSNICGIPSAIEDKRFLVQPDDIEGFCQAILRSQKECLVSDVQHRRERLIEKFAISRRENFFRNTFTMWK